MNITIIMIIIMKSINFKFKY